MTGKIVTLHHMDEREAWVFVDHVVCIRENDVGTIVHLDGGQHLVVREPLQEALRKMIYP